MKKSLEKSTVSLASERGYSFRAVNHDGAPIFCQDGVLQEIFPGIYITVDPQSGIGLIEVNPSERTAKFLLNGQDVLDIVQVTRRDVLTIDGKNYVFLKYMDAYFNQDRVRSQVVAAAETSSKVVQFVTAERQPTPIAANSPAQSVIKRMPKRTKILASVTAAVTVASISAAIFFGPKSSSPLEEKKVESRVVETAPVKPVKKAPATINDLIEDDDKVAVVETAQPAKKEVVSENPPVKTETSPAAKTAAAIWIKPTPPNKVKKPTATPAPAATVSDAAMKSFENDYQEAVLIKGYDQERSVRILKQLQQKVPAGTALRQKIEKELR